MPAGPHRCLRFGSFQVDADARVLLKNGIKIRLQEQPFEVLLALLESPGEIVTREQLRQRLWPHGTFVDFDDALNTAVKKIRAALCDDAAVPRYIETIPRRGYRFLAALDKALVTDAHSSEESAVTVPSGVGSRRSFRRRIVTVAVALALFLLSAWVISRSVLPNNVTVAVLPFSNMNLYSTVQPAPAALSELLARQLRQTHPDKVVIRNAAGSPNRTFSRTKPEEAPLDFVVQGSVLVDAQHLRIVVQLVRLRDQNCIWAREFDRDSDDAETEADLAQQIAADMQQPLASLSAAPR